MTAYGVDLPFKANGIRDPQVFDIQDGETGAAFDFSGDAFEIRLGRRRPDGVLDPLLVITADRIAFETVTINGSTWNRFTVNPDPADLLTLASGIYPYDAIRYPEAGTPEEDGVNEFEGAAIIKRGVSE